jgi:arsenite-transporting ATPase
VFAGKGGVGKTTLACATAMRLAREWRGDEILLFSTDPAHSLGDCLDVAVGPRPVRVMDGLTALEIDAEAEFEQLKQGYRREVDELLRSMLKTLDLTFDRPVMERMLDLSPPGLDEIMALTSAMQFMADGKYQRLILDSAPTGHLIRLLEVPEIIDGWLKAFFELLLKYRNVFRPTGLAERLVATSKELKHFRRTLIDARLTSLYAVAILTEVALAETEDLLATCERLQLPVPVLFLNMATPAESSNCPSCAQRAREEARVKQRFARAAAAKHQTVVYRQSEPRGLAALERLGGALYAGGS